MLKLLVAIVAVLILGPAARAAAPPATDYAAAGSHRVAVLEGEWSDPARQRTVPYLIRYPADVAAPAPVVIFSHGLGGSRRGAAYYGDHLASHGYVVVYVQHPGSDVSIWQGRPLDLERARQSLSPRAALDRFGDIPFALNQLTALNGAPGPLRGRLDMTRVGMSGHSFGALTTQVMAGQVFPGRQSAKEPRFRAFLAMSPSHDRQDDNARAFGAIDRPFLFLTGTKDTLVLGPGAGDVAPDRVKPFEAMGKGPETLVVLTGGDHMVFSGRQEMGVSRPKDDRFRSIVKAASLAFWDAYLRDDDRALAWLRGRGLAAFAGTDAAVTSRGPPRG